MEITDQDILSMKTVPTKTAAAYLGMNWWALTDMLQQGKASFGHARLCPGGTWSYTILPERLYKYKHGLDCDQAAEIIAQKLAEVVELINEWRGGAA